MRFRLVVMILAGLLAGRGLSLRAEEPVTEDRAEALRKLARANEEKSLTDRDAGYKELEKKVSDMKAARQKANEPQTNEITIDEQKITVKEPGSVEEALGFTGDRRVRDPLEFSPDDFDIATRDRWAINLSDFRFDAPRHITIDTAGSERTFEGFTFSITNSSTKPRRIAPVFTAITDKGVFSIAAGGYLPERMFADAMSRPLGGSTSLADKELAAQNIAPLESVVDMLTSGTDKTAGNLKPAYTFEPGKHAGARRCGRSSTITSRS